MLALAQHLPVDSALARSYTEGVTWGWEQEMQATSLELMQAAIRVQMAAAGAKKVPDGIAVPRPYTAAKAKTPKRQATMAEALSIVGRALGGGG